MLTEMQDCFNMFDRDGQGRVVKDKLGNMVRALGFNPTQQKIDEIANNVASGEKNDVTLRFYTVKPK